MGGPMHVLLPCNLELNELENCITSKEAIP